MSEFKAKITRNSTAIAQIFNEMLIYWLLPKISTQREKCDFPFAYKTNGFHHRFGRPSMACAEALNKSALP